VATFLLTTGRWGSYLGIPSANVFVTDVAVAVTAVWVLVWHGRSFDVGRLRPLVPVLALALCAAVRFAAGGNFDVHALRDLAPYGYMVVALAAGFVASTYGRTLQVLAAGLLVHLAWVLLALLLPAWTGDLAQLGGKVRILEIRADFDSAVLVMTAGLAFYVATRGGHAVWVRCAAAAVSVLSAGLVFELGSRSGVLGLAVVTVILALSQRHLLRRLGWRRRLAAAGVLVGLAVVLLPQTYVFERVTADPRLGYAGAGSLNARQQAWDLVVDDAAENPTRLVLGSGFGRDFLDESGARFALEGNVDTGVRAPHNFVLNTLGRMGLVGVLLLGWVGFALVRATLSTGRVAHDPDQHRFLSFTVLVLASLATAAMVGVILESPFGAVPFWWAAGFLLVGTSVTQSRPERGAFPGNRTRQPASDRHGRRPT
jgi:hypothetical protein